MLSITLWPLYNSPPPPSRGCTLECATSAAMCTRPRVQRQSANGRYCDVRRLYGPSLPYLFSPLCVTHINTFWGKWQLVQMLHFFPKEENGAEAFEEISYAVEMWI